jgi:hypothetical protein
MTINSVSNKNFSPVKPDLCWAVTGTFHGSIVYAKSEGDARRAFHKHYNGESITHIKITQYR